jgi:uncharacterized RDD family membrane protein YckC
MFRRTSRRIGAYLIDIALLFVVLAPLGQLVLRLFGRSPRTGPEIWLTILVNFSLPCWLYFIIGARSAGGATLGKRWLGLRLVGDRGPVSTPQAILRTALLLLPWELVHLSVFGLAKQVGRFDPVQWVGLSAANILTVGYLLVTIATEGRRGVHDYVAHTSVDAVTSLAASRDRRHESGTMEL